MALSDITRKSLRSDLRSRLNKLTTDEFSDAEINQWLNLGQFDVFLRLSTISDIWYGTTQTVSITATANTITSVDLSGNYGADKIAKIKKLVTSGNILIPFKDDTELTALLQLSGHTESYGVNWFGEKLYIFVGSAATALSSDSSTLYFIRKPDEMTADNNVHTILFTGQTTAATYFRIWLGDRFVTVYCRTTAETNDDSIFFLSNVTAATQATNLSNALNHAFPSGSGLTITVATATVTITGATNVQNMDIDNATFTATTETCLDVPSEFADLVIMSALSKALFKLNMLGEKQQVEADISQRFNDIRQLYSNEMQLMQAERLPGIQTPRNR